MDLLIIYMYLELRLKFGLGLVTCNMHNLLLLLVHVCKYVTLK